MAPSKPAWRSSPPPAALPPLYQTLQNGDGEVAVVVLLDSREHLLTVSVEGLPSCLADTDLPVVGGSHSTVDGANLPRTPLCTLGLHVDLGDPVQSVLGVGELPATSPYELLEPGMEEVIIQLGGECLLNPPGTWIHALFLVLDGVLRWLLATLIHALVLASAGIRAAGVRVRKVIAQVSGVITGSLATTCSSGSSSCSSLGL